MTDRELLEAAAKAVNGGGWHPLTHNTPNGAWNPLTDDGDALRLAVKLGLDVLNCPEAVEVHASQHSRTEDGEKVSPWAWESLLNADPHAATRRAIVRAAAAIGGAR